MRSGKATRGRERGKARVPVPGRIRPEPEPEPALDSLSLATKLSLLRRATPQTRVLRSEAPLWMLLDPLQQLLQTKAVELSR